MMKQNKKFLALFLAGTIFLLFVVLGFSAFMNYLSLKNNYVTSLSSSFAVAGIEGVKKIEYAVKYGKPLESFYGMTPLLQNIKNINTDIANVRVLLPSGVAPYSLEKDDIQYNDRLLRAIPPHTAGTKESMFFTVLEEGLYHILIPIHAKDMQHMGVLDIMITEEVVNAKVASLLAQNFRYLTFIAIFAAMLLPCILFFYVAKKRQLPEKKFLFLTIAIVLGLAQLFYTLLNVNMFRSVYIQTAQENTQIATKIIQKEINRIVQSGVPYSELYDIDGWLRTLVGSIPEISVVNLVTVKSEVEAAKTASQATKNRDNDIQYYYQMPMTKDREGQSASIEVSLSKAYVDKKIRSLLLDAGTLFLTSMLFMIETIFFILLFVRFTERRYSVFEEEELEAAASSVIEEENLLREEFADSFYVEESKSNIEDTDEDTDEDEKGNLIGILRPLAFLFSLGCQLPTTFIPVVMQELYGAIPGFSAELSFGLPITAYIFGTMMTTLSTGSLLEKFSWKMPFYSGLVMIAIGLLGSALAKDPMVFVLTRFIDGLGYGLVWMSFRGITVSVVKENVRQKLFNDVNAGMYAGINCAAVFGAMLSERIGFANVFFVAFVSLLATIASGWLATRTFSIDTRSAAGTKKEKSGILKFILRPKMLLFFLLIAVPSSLCIMFLKYQLPLYSKFIDVSQSTVGRMFMFYGILTIYLAPFLSKSLSKRMPHKYLTILSFAVAAFGFIVFALWPSLMTAVFTVVCLGVSDSFGIGAQNEYFLNITSEQNLSRNLALSVYNTLKRVGQMIGPYVFAWASFGGLAEGTGIVGILCILAIVVYFILAGRREEAKASA